MCVSVLKYRRETGTKTSSSLASSVRKHVCAARARVFFLLRHQVGQGFRFLNQEVGPNRSTAH